jgi:hypothetical protein
MGSTNTFILSLCIGVSLFTLTLLLAYVHTTYNINLTLLKWVVLPVLGYGITVGFNSFIQVINCGSVNIKQIALGSLSVPLAILVGLVLSLSSFIRSPVESAFGSNERGLYGLIFAIAFWMFWAGMFGESFSSGFAQSCGTQSVGNPLPK